MKRTEILKDLVKLSLTEFTRWHKRFMPGDKMTAEERYVSIGGKKKSKGV